MDVSYHWLPYIAEHIILGVLKMTIERILRIREGHLRDRQCQSHQGYLRPRGMAPMIEIGTSVALKTRFAEIS